MKITRTKPLYVGVMLALTFFVRAVNAADDRELLYNFEILRPNHQQKPKVELGTETRIEETFTRGLTAFFTPQDYIYLSWRLLKTDATETGFMVYRRTHDTENALPGQRTLLTLDPITRTTDFFDENVTPGQTYTYEVFPADTPPPEKAENGASATITAKWKRELHRIPLKDNIDPQRVAVGDLNGDGRWDFIVLHPNRGIDPGGKPNEDGLTYKLDAYLDDGTFLWRYDLGEGIEPGVWYSPFIVYDFDGDGRAEVALKAAPQSVKRDETGRVTEGMELLLILDGMTGDPLVQADWPPRTPRLGDYNRNNRNQLTVAWLDGKTPCIVALRGTYKAMFAHAWQYKAGKLIPVWQWDGDEENPVVRGQGAHNSQVADVDGDGRDEILLGSAMLDDNGTLLWSAGVGHSDSAILTVIDPRRPGMQVLYGNEVPHATRGVCMVDAKTGRRIWDINQPTKHIGGAMAADIDPEKPGLECFAAEDSKGGSRDRYMLDAEGTLFRSGGFVPGTRDWVWWDDDLLREMIHATASRKDSSGEILPANVAVRNYLPGKTSESAVMKGRLVMIADLYGDWREEIVTVLPGELLIYATEIHATDRRTTLLADPKYRIDVINRSQGYSQSPVPGFYLGR